MKSVARSHFWWKGLDQEIETLVKSCLTCQAVKSAPALAPLHPWVWPNAPWRWILIDFAGLFLGKMFLIVMDAHSKWPEVIVMPSTTSQTTIETLQILFSHYGLQEQVISDNGPQFTLDEFAQFMQGNRIKNILCVPFHPASNGLEEWFVQTFKRAMKAGEKDGSSLNHRLT